MSDPDFSIYPNADQEGRALPFDVIRSLGTLRQAFTVTAANAIAIPAGTEILVVYSDDDTPCYIQLGGAAAVPSSGTYVADLHFIPASSMKCIDIKGATTFGIISYNSTAGVVHIEAAQQWRDAKNLQQRQRT